MIQILLAVVVNVSHPLQITVIILLINYIYNLKPILDKEMVFNIFGINKI